MSATGEIQLDGMNRQELSELQAQVDKALRESEKRGLKDLVSEIRSLIDERGYKLDEVLAQMTGPRTTLPAKYVNPKNPDQRWSGRGRKPSWLIEAIQSGAAIETFEVH